MKERRCGNIEQKKNERNDQHQQIYIERVEHTEKKMVHVRGNEGKTYAKQQQ